MTEGLDLHLHADADAQLPLEDRLPVAQYVRMSTEHQKYPAQDDDTGRADQALPAPRR